MIGEGRGGEGGGRRRRRGGGAGREELVREGLVREEVVL